MTEAEKKDIAKNKAITLAKIKDYWPKIEQSGIDAIMANVQAETSFLSSNNMEGGPSWEKNRSLPKVWSSINKNLDSWAVENDYVDANGKVDEVKAKAAYSKLTNVQKNGVRYQGDEDKEGGGYGALQITVNNYGLESRSDTLDSISKTLIDPATNKPYKDFNSGVKPLLAGGDFSLGLDVSFSYYRDEHSKPWTTGDGGSFDLNNMSGHELRYNKGGINYHELHAQKDADGNKIKNPKPPKHVGNAFSSYNTGETKDYSPKEKRAIDKITKMDKTIALHRDQSSAFASLEDNNKFEVKTKLENILKDVHADMKSGKFDEDMLAQYEKDGRTLPLLKDASRQEIVSGIIAEKMGWNDLDLNNPEILGIARAQSSYVFELSQSQEFRESIGGTQNIDSLLEDVLEDSSNTSDRFAEFTGIPELGYALPEVEKEVRTPIGQGGVKGGKEEDVSIFAEPGKKGKINLDGYEQWRDEYARENAPSLFFDQTGDQSTTSLVDDAQVKLENSRVENTYDETIDEDEDVDEDFEIEEVSLPVTPDLERSLGSLTTEELADYEGWLSDNPDGAFEDWNKLPAANTDASAESDEYFDLRGEGAFEESFLDKLGGVSSLIGLATGVIGLGAALKDVDIPKDPKLGPAFQQRLSESKRLAQQGLTPSELAKAHNDLDSSYATGIENIVRGSAGNRAQFMAGLGGLDVARQSALMDIAVADAGMQRQNQQKYDSMMMVNEQYEAGRQAKYQDAQFAQDTAKQAAGAALAGTSMSMIANSIGDRHLNRYNKMKTEKLMMDMGYKATKDGKSGQKQLGTNEDGENVQTSFSLSDLPGGDNYEDPNLLSAPDQAVNTQAQSQMNVENFANQNQGFFNLISNQAGASSGLIDPGKQARDASLKVDSQNQLIKNNAISNLNKGLNY